MYFYYIQYNPDFNKIEHKILKKNSEQLENENLGAPTETHTQQGDLISLKIRGRGICR
jgi:hypothetical protein